MKTSTFNTKLTQNQLSILCFSLFSGWLLSVPFEGKIICILMENQDTYYIDYNISIFILHFIGLFISGFFINPYFNMTKIMVFSTFICILGSIIFFMPFSPLWYISISTISFFSGIYVAAWGYQFKNFFPKKSRLKAATSVLIYSNIIMILLDVMAVNLSVYMAFFLSIVILIGSLSIIFRLTHFLDEITWNKPSTKHLGNNPEILKPFIVLCLFILIISINSGFMYNVVNPAFSTYEFLTSYYWAVPYILVLLILKNMSDKFNQVHILYVGLSMIGISYIAFMWLNCTILNYFIINTLMLGAFGIYDLFFWTTLGNFLDYTENPIQIFGIGLSMNVLGIFIGRFISNLNFLVEGENSKVSSIALAIVFIVLIILPILSTLLARLFESPKASLENQNIDTDDSNLDILYFKDKVGLTDREVEVVEFLLNGYTYKAVSESLYISENTVKFHIKNIYQKFQVKSKMELIKIFNRNEVE